MSRKLRKIPLYNKYGLQYPNNLPATPKFYPKFSISQLPNPDEMFTPWVNTIDKIVKENQLKLDQITNFEQFYTDNYLSKKPIGLISGNNINSTRINDKRNETGNNKEHSKEEGKESDQNKKEKEK